MPAGTPPPGKTPLTIIKFEDGDDAVPITISPCPLDGDLDDRISESIYRIWMEERVYHAKTPPPTGSYRLEDEFAGTEDLSGDPFRFCLFGRSERGRRMGEKFAQWCPSLCVPLVGPGQPATIKLEDSAEEGGHATSLELEKRRIKCFNQTARIKLNLRLALVAGALQVAALGVMGCKYSMAAWISLSVQLVFNAIASATQLWRYTGHYAIFTNILSRELRQLVNDRERLSRILQGSWKVLTSVGILGLGITTMSDSLTYADLEAYERMVYLGAGFCIGGFIVRTALAGWITYIWRQHESIHVKSLNAEAILTYAISLSSLKLAVICFVMIYSARDLAQVQNLQKVNAYIEAGIAAVLLCTGIKELTDLRKDA